MYTIKSSYSSSYISSQPESFAASVENLVEAFCRSHETTVHNVTDPSEEVERRLSRHTEIIIEALSKNNNHMEPGLQNMQRELMSKLDEKMNVATLVKQNATQNNEGISRQLDTIQRNQESLANNMQAMIIKKNTNRSRGEEGERGVIEVLEEVLTQRDGYEIRETKALPHACDILVTRVGKPDVRLEVKNHAGSVRAAEVKRFEEDILALNDHGIFISLSSSIVGKENLQIDLLDNNKLAVFIGKNSYDAHTICEVLNLIYKIHFLLEEKEGRVLSSSTLGEITKHLLGFKEKVKQVKLHLKQSLDIMAQISTAAIETLLASATPGASVQQSMLPEPSAKRQALNLPCPNCDKVFARPCALATHAKTCV